MPTGNGHYRNSSRFLKKYLAMIAGIAGLGAVSLVPSLSNALTATIETSSRTNREQVNRFVSFKAGVSDLQRNPSSAIMYNWDFGDGESSELQETSHKWANITEPTSKTITLGVKEYFESQEIGAGASSVTLTILPTPLSAERRDYDEILKELRLEGQPYRVKDVSPGDGTIKAIYDQDKDSTDVLFLQCDKGVYSQYPPLGMNRPNTIIVGNSIHKGDILVDGFLPSDSDGTSETTVLKGVYNLKGDNSGFYDLYSKRLSGGEGALNLCRSNSVIKDCILDRCGLWPVQTDSEVTTATLSNLLFYLNSGEGGIRMQGDVAHEGVVAENCRFDEEGYMTAGRGSGAVGADLSSIAILSYNPTIIRGCIFNTGKSEEVVASSSSPFKITFCDFGRKRRIPLDIQGSLVALDTAPGLSLIDRVNGVSNPIRNVRGFGGLAGRLGAGSTGSSLYDDKYTTVSATSPLGKTAEFEISGYEKEAPQPCTASNWTEFY